MNFENVGEVMVRSQYNFWMCVLMTHVLSRCHISSYCQCLNMAWASFKLVLNDKALKTYLLAFEETGFFFLMKEKWKYMFSLASNILFTMLAKIGCTTFNKQIQAYADLSTYRSVVYGIKRKRGLSCNEC